MPKPTIALDVETVGVDWESLDPKDQTYLHGSEPDEAKREEVRSRLALHPGTAGIVAIGLWHVDEERGRVLLNAEAASWTAFGERAQMFRGSEAEMLREFWRLARDLGTIVTFNGRSFDGPFLMIRSAIQGVAPTRNLVPYRYSFQDHCDLMDVLSFWGARSLRGTLDFWCRRFGIDSPKRHVTGAEVGALFKAGRLDELAQYCLDDARATAQLYARLKPIIQTLDTRG